MERCIISIRATSLDTLHFIPASPWKGRRESGAAHSRAREPLEDASKGIRVRDRGVSFIMSFEARAAGIT